MVHGRVWNLTLGFNVVESMSRVTFLFLPDRGRHWDFSMLCIDSLYTYMYLLWTLISLNLMDYVHVACQLTKAFNYRALTPISDSKPVTATSSAPLSSFSSLPCLRQKIQTTRLSKKDTFSEMKFPILESPILFMFVCLIGLCRRTWFHLTRD